MELRHLRYLAAVARAASFTRAAELLGISQPTLSHQIKQIETELGTVLFDRFPRTVELTAAGRALLPHAERMLKEMDDAMLAVSELQGLLRGTLHMGVFHSFSRSQVSAVLAQFALRYQGVHVVARLLPRLEMERELLEGKLDMAVAYVSEDTEHIHAETLFREELVLAVGPTHPLAGRSTVAMQSLRDQRLILLTPEFASRQFVDRFFVEAGIKPNIVLEMNNIESILSILRATSLASVLSAGAIDEQTGVTTVRLVKPTPKRWVAMLWRKDGQRSAAALRMAEMIREAYRNAGMLADKS